jgi:hypothetical protein
VKSKVFVSGTTLNGLRLTSCAPWPLGSRQRSNRSLAMNIERFAGHHEAREALMLSLAGVTAIMLIESLILLIFY